MYHKKRDIILENIQNELVLRYPGHASEMKIAKIKILKKLLKTSSWTEICNMNIEILGKALTEIKKIVIKKPK